MAARSSVLLALLLFVAGTPRGVEAQTAHAASEAALDAAIHQHVARISTDREAILRVLKRSEVTAVAGRAGIDLRTKEGAIATLQGEDLARVATLARQIEDRLAGGASSKEWTIYILGLAIIPLIAVLFVVL
jgi:hypothetical protein